MNVVDFINAPSTAETAINDWVAGKTNDKIDPLLGPNAITNSTRVVIVNAVYFDAAWSSQFDKSETQPGTFTRMDGTTVTTPLMASGSAASGYFKGSNFQAVELPYSGGTTSMVVVLPDDGAFSAVEKGLTGSFYDSVTSGLGYSNPIDLTMPSFKIHGATISLKNELQSLGMTDAFTDAADFSGLTTTTAIHIGDVLHQAFVDVDENGTEAAAATAVIFADGGAVAGPPPKIITVDVDRSFFFFIRDTATNTVLFVGREDDPTAQ
jgi:serpin B